MNDFSEIESELKKLRPAPPSADLLRRVEEAIVDLSAEDKVVRPPQFRANWLWLGASLAAAAVILIFLRFDFQKQTQPAKIAKQTAPLPSTFIPAGATQVVYEMRNEGLYFPARSEQPVRRMRAMTRETWQWRNPATGASLQVSYPAEHVALISVPGQ